MCFAINKDYISEDAKIKMKSESDVWLANQSSDYVPASKCYVKDTQVGVGGKLPDAGEQLKRG
tara:strand:- start:1758 stop:1946 length:189 start_codon:yes stop_codon:yes gene_type:complete